MNRTSKKLIETPEGYVEATAVRDALRVTHQQWNDLLAATGIDLYTVASDRRRRYVRKEDAQRLMRPMRVENRRIATAA